MSLTADLRMYRHSGIGRYLRNLFPLVLPLLQTEHVRVLGQSNVIGDEPWRSDPRVEFVETPAPIYSLPEQALLLRGTYRGSSLLWVPHYNAPLYHPGKMVVTIHDIAPIALPEIMGSALKRAYARLLIHRAVQQSAAVLCVSSFTQRELLTRLAVDAAKTTVTHLGLDRDWNSPASPPVAPHVEPDGAPYLLFVGNVKPNKNLPLLLRAFAAVRDQLPHRLLLAGRSHGFTTGDGPVLQQAEALGDRVRFTGEIDDASLRSLYAGAAALVLPSLYEGFGLPLLEAMSLGCPILSSTAGSLPEIAGDAALYFDPRSEPQLSECLLRVASAGNPLLDSLRQRGRARLQQFSFDRCALQTAQVMNRLMREP